MKTGSASPRLIAALSELPLTREQIERILPAIQKDKKKLEEWNGAEPDHESPYWDFSGKIQRAAALLGIKEQTYLHKAAVRQPSLFTQAPETINANIEYASTLLGIDKKTYVESAALRIPSLFCQSAEKVNDNIESAASLLKVHKNIYITRFALKQPALFTLSPETIHSKIELSIDLLGLDKATFIKVALRQPSLLYMSPETVYSNMEQAANILQFDTSAYVARSAIRQPALFTLSPKTIARNLAYVLEAASKGYIHDIKTPSDIMHTPSTLTYGTANTHMRSIHAHIFQQNFSLSCFFSKAGRNKKNIETDILDHYRDRYESTGLGLRAVQIMAEAGIISALPDWAPAPDAPLRQRTRNVNHSAAPTPKLS